MLKNIFTISFGFSRITMSLHWGNKHEEIEKKEWETKKIGKRVQRTTSRAKKTNESFEEKKSATLKLSVNCWWRAGWRTANHCNSGKKTRPWLHANLETATMLILARTHVHAHLHSAAPWITKMTTMTLGHTSHRTCVSLVCVCLCQLCTFQVVEWFNFHHRLLHFQEGVMENTKGNMENNDDGET